MSDQEDEDLRLRDKLAAAALPALMQRFNEKVDTKWLVSGKTTADFNTDIEAIVLMAYKIADAMRKARLQAFT